LIKRITPESVLFRYRASKMPQRFAKEFAVVGPRLRRDRNAADIGAHIGLFSRFLAERSSRVVSFEPDPVLFRTLKRFAPSNVEPRNIALSDSSGSGVLATPIIGGEAGRGNGSVAAAAEPGAIAVNIQLARLDDQNLSNLQFMKIDVEGHELAVLRGGANVLREERPTIWMEVEQRFYPDRPLADVLKEIESYGYRGWFFADQQRPASEFSVERYQVLNSGDYINNFLFEPV
jgi:FkbM family methyltransferase